MELPGESSLAKYSAASMMPEMELVLVAAEDWTEVCCCVVLADSSDSRLLRNTS